MIVPRYYENLNVLHENTMPPRAYYIPKHPKEWIIWWNTGKNQTVCSY